jgi:glutamate-1-semialdehyde aminotransferase
VLDPFHVKRAIRLAFGNVLDAQKVITQLYEQGFDTVEETLLQTVVGGTKAEVKARLNCLHYLRHYDAEIVPAMSLGAIESNVDKLIAQRMKTRGVSWSVAGAKSMLSLLAHQNELYENSFQYQTRQKKSLLHQQKIRKANAATIPSACFPVLRSGKMSAPYATLFKAIINDDLPLSS